MSIHLVLGPTPIIVEDHLFCEGYQQGYAAFTERQQRNPMTEMQVYEFVVRTILTILTITSTDRYNTGYLVGWIAALHGVGSGGAMIGYATLPPEFVREPHREVNA
jgi:hypothetical protein